MSNTPADQGIQVARQENAHRNCITCGGNGYVTEQTEDKTSEQDICCPDCGGSCVSGAMY